MKTFRDYLAIRDLFREEVDEPRGDGSSEKPSGSKSGNGAISAQQKFTLGQDESGPQPFVVGTGKDQHPEIAILIKAFDEPVEFGPQQIDKAGGTKRNVLKGKKLYLVGGAVRDILVGKTPKDYDLATDATVDEIRLILSNYGFAEIAPKAKMGGKEGYDVAHEKYANLPQTSKNPYQFSIIGTDMNDQEMVVQVKINGQIFELATFREDAKTDGRAAQVKLTGDIRKDAERRDFTMNSLYIGPLKIGENKDVIDFYGGVQDALSGRVKFVGDPSQRLEEDQLRALRYLRFKGRFDDRDVPEKDLRAIQGISGLPRLQPYEDDNKQFRDPRPRIRDEFLKGMAQSQDPAWFFELAEKLGLLGTVFPKMKFKHGGKEKEKHLALAYLLANNDPEHIEETLKSMHWSNGEIERIKFLIDFARRFHPEMEPEDIYGYVERLRGKGKTGEPMFSTGYLRGTKSGKESNLQRWARLQGKGEDWERGVDALLHTASLERINVDPDDPDWAEFIDPVTRSIKPSPLIRGRKAAKEHQRFRGLFDERRPKNTV